MWYPVVDTGVLSQVVKDPELIVLTITLLVLIALGVWGILWAKRWGQHDKQTFLSPEEETAAFRRLLEQGLLSQEEFDRVQARLQRPIGPSADAVSAQPEVGIFDPAKPCGPETPPSARPDPSPSPEPPSCEPPA